MSVNIHELDHGGRMGGRLRQSRRGLAKGLEEEEVLATGEKRDRGEFRKWI